MQTMPKILIVDASTPCRNMLKRRLEHHNHGYHVVTAADDNQAIQTASETHPDIILMNLIHLQLSKMDGWNAIREIKKNPDTQAIPIIGVSSCDNTESILDSIRAACDDYETKPIDFKQLLFKITTLLQCTQPAH